MLTFATVVNGHAYGFHEWDITIADLSKENSVLTRYAHEACQPSFSNPCKLLAAPSDRGCRWACFVVHQAGDICSLSRHLWFAPVAPILDYHRLNHYWGLLYLNSGGLDHVVPTYG